MRFPRRWRTTLLVTGAVLVAVAIMLLGSRQSDGSDPLLVPAALGVDAEPAPPAADPTSSAPGARQLALRVHPAATLPGYMCLTVVSDVFDDMGGSNTNCIPAEVMRVHGFVQTYQVGDGPIAVYGVAPREKAGRVDIPGAAVVTGTDGSFFSDAIPRTDPGIRAEGPDGTWVTAIPYPG